MASRYLHIRADFDENDLTSKLYGTLDEFVEHRSDQFTLFSELEQYIKDCENEEEDPEYCEEYLYKLIVDGYNSGEWDSEEFYEIVDSKSIIMGV